MMPMAVFGWAAPRAGEQLRRRATEPVARKILARALPSGDVICHTSARHLRNVNTPPDSREAPFFILDLHFLSDVIFVGGQSVERYRDIRREIVHLDGKDVAFGDRNTRWREKSTAHADRVLNVLPGRFEDLVCDDALRGLALDWAEEDEPYGQDKNPADCRERKQHVF